ncbi:MAG TPA: hypothetical protein VFZ65_01065 [Planctomycetota bacterium]|nr:hypothetical protein [Planctomycetota bacterium]
MLRTCFAVAAAFLPLAAQELAPSPIQAVGDRIAATANSGLQVDPNGRGLVGGGRDYRVRFDSAGMRYEPALGSQAPLTRFVQLTPVAAHRGGHPMADLTLATAPQAAEKQAIYARAPGLTERFLVRPEGVALSWQFAERPAGNGDLVVRYAVTTNFDPPAARDDGLHFLTEHGGVHIGGVTGIDALGASAPGRLTWIDGQLELALPAAFVDHAAYPLVLDPLVGTEISISTGLTYADGEPDAAYDSPTGRYLVVWRRTFSATDSDVRGQLVFAVGTLSGSTIFFSSSGTVTPPRVANLGNCSRFGVVWSQVVGSTSSVRYQAVQVPAGTIDPIVTIDSTTTSVHGPADIGSDPEAYPQQGRGCLVVWEDEDFDAIRAETISYSSGGSAVLGGQFAVFINGVLGPDYTEPALSRAAAADGWLLLTVRRRNPLTGSSAIEARMLEVDGSLAGITNTIASSPNDDLRRPDVDGYDGHWVVAHERSGSSVPYDAVVVTPVQNAGFTTIAVGNPVTFGGSPLTRASHPTVGYGLGRAWLGYQQVFTLPTPSTTLRIAAIDSTSCASCNDTFTVSSPGGTRIVVATAISGGATHREYALATWHASFDDISAQRLENHGSTGTTVDLGGGCGNAGAVSFNHAPGIGSGAFYCYLQGLPPTTLAAIFNFAPVAATVACGPCVWTPFSITLAPPIAGNYTSVTFAIPCLPSLVGSQFETQWTTVDLSQAPCPAFPGLALSARTLLTIGQ